jgi:ATP-dependent Lon protease
MKVLAAHRAGVKTVLYQMNLYDLKTFQRGSSKMKFFGIDTVDEVIMLAIQKCTHSFGCE